MDFQIKLFVILIIHLLLVSNIDSQLFHTNYGSQQNLLSSSTDKTNTVINALFANQQIDDNTRFLIDEYVRISDQINVPLSTLIQGKRELLNNLPTDKKASFLNFLLSFFILILFRMKYRMLC